MKEQYEALELKIVKFNTEDTILMSGIFEGEDNDGDVGDWGDQEI